MKLMKYGIILIFVELIIGSFMTIYNPLERNFDNTFIYYPILAIVLMLFRVYNKKIGLQVEIIGFIVLGITFILHYMLF